MKHWSLCIGLSLIAFMCQAQEIPVPLQDTTHTDDPIISQSGKSLENAELIKMKAEQYNPRKAGLYSAILPGLGQFYNKKYWKIPLVYGGLIGFAYGINFYQTNHAKFRRELFSILQSKEPLSPSGFNESQLRTIIDRTRRERDFLMVLAGIFYLLNIADAHIDAHLKEFDINEKLKLKLSLDPMITNQNQLQAGLSLKLHFYQ